MLRPVLGHGQQWETLRYGWYWAALPLRRGGIISYLYRGTRCHCATSRQVAGSILDIVIGIFHWHNPFGRTMALGSTQIPREMSTVNISCEVRRPVCRTDNLPTFMCRLSWNLGASTCCNPPGLSRPVKGMLYHLPVVVTLGTAAWPAPNFSRVVEGGSN